MGQSIWQELIGLDEDEAGRLGDALPQQKGMAGSVKDYDAIAGIGSLH